MNDNDETVELERIKWTGWVADLNVGEMPTELLAEMILAISSAVSPRGLRAEMRVTGDQTRVFVRPC